MKLSNWVEQTGCPCTLISDGEFQALEQCTRIRGEEALTYLESLQYAHALENPRISCVICTPEVQALIPAHISGVMITETPKIAFFRLHNDLVRHREKRPTVIDPTASISPLAYVAPYNVVIGKHVELQPFVVVNEGSILQDHVRICSGTVIGAQGYTVIKEDADRAFIGLDAGRTIIEQGVQIGSNCNIECGALQLDTTRIGAYSMIDNGVLIGHGTVIGKRGLIAAETEVSGNCTFGDRLWIGVNATISNAIMVGDDVKISLGAVVTKDVPSGETVTGNFAIPHRTFMRNLKASLAEITGSAQMPPPPRTGRKFLTWNLPGSLHSLRKEVA